MPIYEFVCSQCDRLFESLCRSSSALSDVRCPGCGSGMVEKKFSTFAFSSGKPESRTSGASSKSGCAGCSSHNCSTCH